MTKSYYQNRAGTYFFEALDDDKTRLAYESMGYIMTDRKTVPRLNMRPRIDLTQVPSPETKATDDSNLMPPVVYEIWELFQPTKHKIFPDLKGAERIERTASDLLEYFPGTIVGKLSPREFTAKLFSPGVVEELADLRISVSRRKSNGRKLIVIDRGKA